MRARLISTELSPNGFSAVLRRSRRAAGLTQAQLAERAGISVRGLQHLEAGDAQPYRATLQALVDALGLMAEYREQFEAAARPAWHQHERRVVTEPDSRVQHQLAGLPERLVRRLVLLLKPRTSSDESSPPPPRLASWKYG